MLYPGNKNRTYQKTISHKNRGMALEAMINDTNNYYRDHDIALIYKKPTPIGIVKVKYKEQKKIIDKAYFANKSTLDYNGLYRGKYLDFDAKETTNKTAFPLSNLHNHQLEHIKKVILMNGIAFLIVKINCQYYLLPGEKIITFIEEETRKSIPYTTIKEMGFEIKENYQPSLDYLKIIDQIYFKEDL